MLKDMNFNHIPVELGYVLVALAGGIARYLNGYTSGAPFKLGIFIASTVVSAFSGYMFALLGISMGMGAHYIFMMAGMGGFFGDQALRYLIEIVVKRLNLPSGPSKGV